LKIVEFIQRHPEEELPLVSLPTEREGELAVYREKLTEIVLESEVAPYIISIPWVGSSLVAAFIAYGRGVTGTGLRKVPE
jgi:hypothetical protein